MSDRNVARTSDVEELIARLDGDPPRPRDLYYMWERGQWRAGNLDLRTDREHWAGMSGEDRRLVLWLLAPLAAAEGRIQSALVAFVDAAADEESQVFLTTQLVDEARHAVFYDRFYSEVVDAGGATMEQRLAIHSESLSEPARSLLFDLLPEAAEAIRKEPQAPDHLVAGVTLYQLVTEGGLMLTCLRFLVAHCRDRDVLPGFVRGTSTVVEDIVRHVAFGVGSVRALIAEDDANLDAARAAVARGAPLVWPAFEPPSGSDVLGKASFGPEDMGAYARSLLEARLAVAGVHAELG